MRISLTVALTLVALMAGTKSTFAAPAQIQHLKVDMHSLGKTGTNTDRIREFWLAGIDYARVDEQKPQNAGTMSSIITPSDTWQIDMGSKRGTHIPRVAKGPIAIPILQGDRQVVERFKGLHFGNELQYFEAQKATKSSKKSQSGRALDEYTITDKQLSLAMMLDVDSTSKRPVEMKVQGLSTKTEMTMQFLQYESIPFNDKFFKPPAQIAIKSMTIAEIRAKQAEFEQKMASYRKKLLKEMASQKDSGVVR
jgi:hypothetical protein